MNKQYLWCLKCKSRQPDDQIICTNCKNVYSQIIVHYVADHKISSINDLYRSNLPFGLFKKKNFKNCSLANIGNNIWIKNEGENESKSIKEKDIFVGLEVAKYLNFKSCLCVSGGSGINVINFFSKKHIFPLVLMSPKSANKTTQNQILIGDEYEDTFRLATKIKNKKEFNITPGINPYSQEGAKVISWQIINSKIPFNKIVIPCGNGSSLWSIFKGFYEAKKNKLINKIPEIIGVELKNGPIYRSLYSGKIEKNKHTLGSKAHSIDVKESFSLPKAILAVKKSRGKIMLVTESDIERAHEELGKKNFSVNFTAASAYAAGLLLQKRYKNEMICCILTAAN